MICNLCPRRCGALRTETEGRGVCRMPEAPVVARAALHQWEEPPISGTRGSGTVFFSGCSLGCVFCQNDAISHQDFGRPISLERLHVPHLMVELMELIYRFIFVLTETASRIRLAQESRLGYQGLRRSLSSLGTLASMVFLRAWRKADRVYTALESRGYSGSLVTLSGDYARGAWLYPLTAAVAAVQLAAWYFERRVMG